MLESIKWNDRNIFFWKKQKNNLFVQDEGNLSELLPSVFYRTDMYNPEDDRDEYEFNVDQLWYEVNNVIIEYLNSK